MEVKLLVASHSRIFGGYEAARGSELAKASVDIFRFELSLSRLKGRGGRVGSNLLTWLEIALARVGRGV